MNADLRQLVEDFRYALERSDLHAAMALLNRRADFRFTGVYRFEDELVMNVVIYDRENPELRVAEDVRMEDAYCRITAQLGDRCVIEDAASDPRVAHLAPSLTVRSYCAVLLRDGDAALGTLCHFDLVPRAIPAAVLAELDAVRDVVEGAVLERRGLPPRDPTPRIAEFAPRPTDDFLSPRYDRSATSPGS